MGDVKMPTLHTRKERFDSILNNTPGLFSFDAHGISPEQKDYAYNWYSNREFGTSAVRANNAHIDRLAAKYHLDPNFLHAIVYMENAHGWYDEHLPWNETYRPGNVNPDLWGALVPYSKEQLKNDPAKNLELTAKFLSRLQKRLPNRSVESMATLYNGTQKDRVTGYGLTVRRYYDDMPWRPTPRPALGFQGSPEAFPSQRFARNSQRPAMGFFGSPEAFPSQRLPLALASPGKVSVDPSRAHERFYKMAPGSGAASKNHEKPRSVTRSPGTKPGGRRSGGLLSHHLR